jgi:hypothetical protein
MTPPSIVELRIEKDRLTIEMGNKSGIDPTAVDGL